MIFYLDNSEGEKERERERELPRSSFLSFRDLLERMLHPAGSLFREHSARSTEMGTDTLLATASWLRDCDNAARNERHGAAFINRAGIKL